MEKRFHKRLSSVLGSEDFLDDYTEKLATILPLVLPLHADLKAILAKMWEATGEQGQDNSGWAIAKNNIRLELRAQLYNVALGLHLYHWQRTDSPALSMEQQTGHQVDSGLWHYTQPAIKALDDAALYSLASRAARQATPLVADLLAVTAEHLTNLADTSEAFLEKFYGHARANTASAEARKEAINHLANAMTLRKTIDIYMCTLQSDHPDFYAEWEIGLRIGKYK